MSVILCEINSFAVQLQIGIKVLVTLRSKKTFIRKEIG